MRKELESEEIIGTADQSSDKENHLQEQFSFKNSFREFSVGQYEESRRRSNVNNCDETYDNQLSLRPHMGELP